MDRKARENLEAAKHLLCLDEPCTNAAATRAYYAAYHALWAGLAEQDEQPSEPRPGIRYFPHKSGSGLESIADVAERCLELSEDEIEDLERLWDFRVKADYMPDDVVADEAKDCYEAARAIVARVVGEGEQ